MPPPQRTHRASAQRRRLALLDAAAELIAELGAGAVTHRAVAARAQVPLSTTSYFFSSIAELVAEAMALGARRHLDEWDAAASAVILSGRVGRDEVLAGLVTEMVTMSTTAQHCHVELYLAAGRNRALRADADEVAAGFRSRAERLLRQAGVTEPEAAAAAAIAVCEGFMLRQLSGDAADHETLLRTGLELVLEGALRRAQAPALTSVD